MQAATDTLEGPNVIPGLSTSSFLAEKNKTKHSVLNMLGLLVVMAHRPSPQSDFLLSGSLPTPSTFREWGSPFLVSFQFANTGLGGSLRNYPKVYKKYNLIYIFREKIWKETFWGGPILKSFLCLFIFSFQMFENLG